MNCRRKLLRLYFGGPYVSRKSIEHLAHSPREAEGNKPAKDSGLSPRSNLYVDIESFFVKAKEKEIHRSIKNDTSQVLDISSIANAICIFGLKVEECLEPVADEYWYKSRLVAHENIKNKLSS